MATSKEYIDYVCEQVESFGDLRYRKMFGEYMVYLNDNPVLLVCDNTVFVKKLPELAALMSGAACGLPYEGTKEHYILDIEDRNLLARLLPLLETLTPLPKPRKRIAQ